MSAVVATGRTTAVRAREVIDRYVERIALQDLDGVVGLYAPDARWEVHVPGWDTVAEEITDVEELLFRSFVENRHDFAVDGYQLFVDRDAVALRWGLSWRDRQDGAYCTCFQSHFFQVQNGRIRRHQMYCAGVRA